MPLRYLLRIDWDVIAGIIAAITAMLLSFMGVVSETVGRGIILLLCALLLIRDLRSEAREHRMFDKLDVIRRHVANLVAARQAEVHLIGAKKMRMEVAEFAGMIYGEVRWFNACCRMFRRQEVFDATLRPFLENPNITRIHLLCRPDDRQNWLADLLPKLRACDQGDKVQTPLWGEIRTKVSFFLADIDGDGGNEALLSIAEEPFSTVNQGPSVPRFLLRVYAHCDLMASLEEMARHATSDFATTIENASGLADGTPARADAAATAPTPRPADPAGA